MTVIKLGDDADDANKAQANAAQKETSDSENDKGSASDVAPKEQPSNADAPVPPPTPPPLPPPAPAAPVSQASPPPPPEKIAVRPLHRFTLPYRNGVHTFDKDQIIVDPLLVKFMIQNNCPVVRVEEKIDYQVCPHCHRHF